jgi:uncharacterized membrane protein
MPVLGAAIGAGMDGMTGALADVGISDGFIKEVRDKVTEGTSGLYALTLASQGDGMFSAVEVFGLE